MVPSAHSAVATALPLFIIYADSFETDEILHACVKRGAAKKEGQIGQKPRMQRRNGRNKQPVSCLSTQKLPYTRKYAVTTYMAVSFSACTVGRFSSAYLKLRAWSHCSHEVYAGKSFLAPLIQRWSSTLAGVPIGNLVPSPSRTKSKFPPSRGRGQGDHTSARLPARATPPLPSLVLGPGAVGAYEEAGLP